MTNEQLATLEASRDRLIRSVTEAQRVLDGLDMVIADAEASKCSDDEHKSCKEAFYDQPHIKYAMAHPVLKLYLDITGKNKEEVLLDYDKHHKQEEKECDKQKESSKTVEEALSKLKKLLDKL